MCARWSVFLITARELKIKFEFGTPAYLNVYRCMRPRTLSPITTKIYRVGHFGAELYAYTYDMSIYTYAYLFMYL